MLGNAHDTSGIDFRTCKIDREIGEGGDLSGENNTRNMVCETTKLVYKQVLLAVILALLAFTGSDVDTFSNRQQCNPYSGQLSVEAGERPLRMET